ncbi:MAG: LptF/LptG family permease, partial [Deltaproteobacteria bacterium]|nr:LptF/LptG family permease [Deltaproteobacteria bacterium]
MRCFFRAALPPALATGALAWVLLSIAGLGQALLATSAAPGARLLGQLALAVLGSTAGLALGVACLAGAAGAVARLREEGALLALAAAGLPPRRLAWLSLGLALPLALASLVVSHEAEPRARALVRDTRALVAASVAPAEGETVRLGSWWMGV